LQDIVCYYIIDKSIISARLASWDPKSVYDFIKGWSTSTI